MTGTKGSPFGRPVRERIPRHLVTVTLECGDQITAQNAPLHNKARYACRAGKGHGYNLRWVNYHNSASGHTQDNPDVQLPE